MFTVSTYYVLCIHIYVHACIMLIVVLLLSHVWLFCNPMDCSTLGFSIHGISQAQTLDWVAISFFRESFQPRDRTYISCVSCIGRWILYLWATKGVLYNSYHLPFCCQLLMLIWNLVLVVHFEKNYLILSCMETCTSWKVIKNYN